MARTVIDIDEKALAKAQELTGLRKEGGHCQLRAKEARGAEGSREDPRPEGDGAVGRGPGEK